MKTSRNTPQRHITAYCIQFNGRLFNNITEKLKVGLFVCAFRTLKFPWHFGNALLKQFAL